MLYQDRRCRKNDLEWLNNQQKSPPSSKHFIYQTNAIFGMTKKIIRIEMFILKSKIILFSKVAYMRVCVNKNSLKYNDYYWWTNPLWLFFCESLRPFRQKPKLTINFKIKSLFIFINAWKVDYPNLLSSLQLGWWVLAFAED